MGKVHAHTVQRTVQFSEASEMHPKTYAKRVPELPSLVIWPDTAGPQSKIKSQSWCKREVTKPSDHSDCLGKTDGVIRK